MKKFIISFVLIGLCIIGISLLNANESTYTRDVIVVSIDDTTITTKDKQGFIWQFISNSDIQEGQHLILVFSNMHTNTIFDDEVIDVK